jgi:hypothetical protein
MRIRNITLYCFLTEEIFVAGNMQTFVSEVIVSDIHDETGDIGWRLYGFPEYLKVTIGIILRLQHCCFLPSS